jgi:hypothetical protein
LGIQEDSSLKIVVETSDNEFEEVEGKLSSSLATILKMDIVFYIADESTDLQDFQGAKKSNESVESM